MEEYSYTSTHPLGQTGPVTGSLYFSLDKYCVLRITGMCELCNKTCPKQVMKTQKGGWNVALTPLLWLSAQPGRHSCQLYTPAALYPHGSSLIVRGPPGILIADRTRSLEKFPKNPTGNRTRNLLCYKCGSVASLWNHFIANRYHPCTIAHSPAMAVQKWFLSVIHFSKA